MINRVLSVLALLMIVQFSEYLVAEPADCGECHSQEVMEWDRSQHAVAMVPAGPETIAGDFSGVTYEDRALRVQFRKKGDSYRIWTDEAGEKHEWIVQYAFGVYPLQQYLIDIGDGRLQAFNVAWDARDKAEGGQRWFRLDEPGDNNPGDAMHWTGIYQNWNNQCADCHSTGLERHYDSESDSYQTRWEHVAVSCSACHDSAKTHATENRKGNAFAAGIELAAMGAWRASEGARPPLHTGPASSDAQVPSCGRCHSLRTNLVDAGTGRIHDQYSLTRLDQPLYYSDGRVREEVFVLGSFEQSKMFQAGVVCTNCHNPHTGKLKAEGNAVCTQCHNASDFDASNHHHHARDSEGAQCVNCHMGTNTFMKIDDRREHSFRVPRPDVAKASGSPDVCLRCHAGKDRDWSIEMVKNWYPDLYQSDTWHHIQQRSLPEIREYLMDDSKPAIRRATLLEHQGEVFAQQYSAVVEQLAGSEQAVLRESAYRVLRYGVADTAGALAEQGLNDPALAVRLAAFESLTILARKVKSRAWENTRDEYEHYINMQADLPSGRVLKAQYLLANNKVNFAEQQLRLALAKDLGYVPAIILLTDILRSDDRHREARQIIDLSLKSTPGNAQLLHLRGLINLKLKDYPAALSDLERAANLEPGQWLFGYRYAVALFQLGQKDKARELTRALVQLFPENMRIEALMRHL